MLSPFASERFKGRNEENPLFQKLMSAIEQRCKSIMDAKETANLYNFNR